MTTPYHSSIVIVGAGFGGMQVAHSLVHFGIEVLLIDRNSYHTFVPLLYQVAVAQLAPEPIIYPIRILQRRYGTQSRRRSRPCLQFLQAEVRQIDLASQTIVTETVTETITETLVISYQYLVLATGTQANFLGIPGASEYALPLRTLEDAIALRDRILTCLAQASREADPERRQQLLTFVIVGGGATGVEVAGALIELIQSLKRDEPALTIQPPQVLLLQAGDRLLPEFPKHLGDYTRKQLHRMGVRVQLQARVSQVGDHYVSLQDGRRIQTATVIWTAGVTAATPAIASSLSQDAKAKLVVLPTLQLPHYANVYAIGDVAAGKSLGHSLSGVAPEALQQGVAVARNLQRQLRGRRPLPFRYFNKGRLAIIGRFTGVGRIGPFNLTGFLPWFLWLSVHLVYLPGFRNRLIVLINWFWNYGLGDLPNVLTFSGLKAR